LSAEQWLTVLSKELITSHDLCVIFIGSKGDWELSERISVELRKTRASAKVQNLCGSCSLLESLKVLGKSEHFFAIDSGLLHFARLLGVPSTSFWGPTDPATLLSFIPGYQEKVYYKPLICSPCIHVAEDPPCGGRNLCIDALFREESFPTSEVLVNITLEPQKRPKS
jgi:ADP-heptose:LPS heptosyltransferase